MDATEGSYVDRLVGVLGDIATAIAGLNHLDDERKADIDELREEVAALGSIVDALRHEVSALGAKSDQLERAVR